jgi:hypothetical protein
LAIPFKFSMLLNNLTDFNSAVLPFIISIQILSSNGKPVRAKGNF